MSDLRDSGSIEQDADEIIFLWPQAMQYQGGQPPAEQEIKLLVEKQRNGPKAEITTTYKRATLTFSDAPTKYI
jgi:replicative DNA helicase